ncbi:uncharacterized protein SCDLUD_001370 [Saccharomycodes ludwigii]|nr:hypothetical protein SCDLUD_001370 [Saccharomycodes ludwigii]KAH3901606.1 hypothetical protein SCDLUD_001370 [Saccharomycodes ludwigii]
MQIFANQYSRQGGDYSGLTGLGFIV